MHRYFSNLFSDSSSNLKTKIFGIYSLLIIYNVVVWLWAFSAYHAYPLLLSTAFLAYTFGLRHAVDADHIAAIDNVTRKLMQDGKRPISAGLFFSFGHSTIVIIASVIVALTTSSLLKQDVLGFGTIGGIIGTSVSAVFLILIAILNIIILYSTFCIFRRVMKGGHYDEEAFNSLSKKRGILARRFDLFFKIITRSWQMYFLGFLFGLGFDTATEIALLSITASQALNELSIWSILIFPALFTAGMTLIDTTDCILMVGAYGWAFIKPIRKLYYNMTITFVSVVVALLIGSLEVLGLIANNLNVSGAGWDFVRDINSHYDKIGYIIIFIFLTSWLLSVLIYHFMRFEKLENKQVD